MVNNIILIKFKSNRCLNNLINIRKKYKFKTYFLYILIILIIGVIFYYEFIMIKSMDDDIISNENKIRSFSVDYNNSVFIKDGEPFRYVSGSFHYFRAHPQTWQRKLRTIRAAGLNAVSTYVEWSLHNPKENVYNWDGIADIEKFIKLAAEEDLLVILRPGPYICAERDMGGFPYWLLRKFPDIQLRTADKYYLNEIRLWYSKLMTRMAKYLYGNGGPIIMVQVENEYGSFSACDLKYREWLRDETHNYVKDKAVLFTVDGAMEKYLNCGSISGVLPTINFGDTDNTYGKWKVLRKYLPYGPLVNSEFYSGWITHWQERMNRISTDSFLATYEDMLKSGANVNFYMFFGGTNFGFTAGANFNGTYKSDITSYDYDAPMDEAGDPTPKYYKIREVTGKYFELPNIQLPTPIPKRNYGTVPLVKCCSILSKEGRAYLSAGTINSDVPQTFETLDQNSGFVLYETKLPLSKLVPSTLIISDIRDRAYVYVDHHFVGVLSRESQVHKIPIISLLGSKLQILVESQGRINFIIANDFKGILSRVFFGINILKNWTITKYPLENYKNIDELINKMGNNLNYKHIPKNEALLHRGPSIFFGDFEINKNDLGDTYLDPTGWSKGLVFVNGFNLGRYWPKAGPQVTIFVPKAILYSGKNRVVLIEYERSSEAADIKLTSVPNLDNKISDITILKFIEMYSYK